MDVRADFSFSNRKIGKEQVVYPFNLGGRRPFSYPYLSFFDKEGLASKVPYQYPTDFINSLDDAGLLDWTFTPFGDQNGGENITKTTNQNIDFQIAYNPKGWLSLEAIYGSGNQYTRVDELFHEESFYVRNLVNRFTQKTDKGYVYGIPEGHIKDLRYADQIAHRARALLRLDKTWHDDHSLNVLLGSEISSLKNTSNSMRFYGFNDRNSSIKPMNFNDLMPTYLRLFPQQRLFLGAGMNERNNRFVSFFANAAYIFRSKYVLTGSARKDAPNVFGVKTNRRWNPLWSVGGMWRIDKENCLQAFPFIHKLNLKGTIGHSGNAGGSSTSLPILSLQAPLSYDLYPLQQAIIQQLLYFMGTTIASAYFGRANSNMDTTLMSFYEPEDIRKIAFFDIKKNGYYTYNISYYGAQDFLFTGFATDELYLIVAECETRIGDPLVGLKWLNTLLENRYFKGKFKLLEFSDKTTLLDRVLQERRKELVFRGVRFSDIKRLNRDERYKTTLVREFNNKGKIERYELPPGDLRYQALIDPTVIQNTGIEQNPR